MPVHLGIQAQFCLHPVSIWHPQKLKALLPHTYRIYVGDEVLAEIMLGLQFKGRFWAVLAVFLCCMGLYICKRYHPSNRPFLAVPLLIYLTNLSLLQC